MRPIVAFQGETGAFSEVAAHRLAGDNITLMPCPTFDDAVRAVVNGHADFCAIPVENIIAGPVHAALDAIRQFDSIEQTDEIQIPIHLAMMGIEGSSLGELREVLSHQMALGQCKKFLSRHPHIHAIEAPDTAGAARIVSIRRDRSVAAIAAPWAAKHYGLIILAEGLEDRPDNMTRFVLLKRVSAAAARESL